VPTLNSEFVTSPSVVHLEIRYLIFNKSSSNGFMWTACMQYAEQGNEIAHARTQTLTKMWTACMQCAEQGNKIAHAPITHAPKRLQRCGLHACNTLIKETSTHLNDYKEGREEDEDVPFDRLESVPNILWFGRTHQRNRTQHREICRVNTMNCLHNE